MPEFPSDEVSSLPQPKERTTTFIFKQFNAVQNELKQQNAEYQQRKLHQQLTSESLLQTNTSTCFMRYPQQDPRLKHLEDDEKIKRKRCLKSTF